MDNKNEPAFGFTDNRSSSYEDNEVHYGLSKREYFAGLAMQGLLANPDIIIKGNGRAVPDLIAEECVKMADALLNELSK